jgi:hypothetical protein
MKLLERAAIWLTALIVCAAFSGVVVLLGLAQIHPYRPRTALGWLVFVVGVPLSWILSEAFGALLGREPMGRWVDRRTSNKRFSWVRVWYLLLRTSFVLALVILTIWAGATYVPGLRDLVARHFGSAA